MNQKVVQETLKIVVVVSSLLYAAKIWKLYYGIHIQY